MILSARSCTLSSLRLSEALQKCQTVRQYDTLGIIRSLANAPTFWLASLHMSLTWLLKESSSSMFIRSIFKFLAGLICWSSIVMADTCPLHSCHPVEVPWLEFGIVRISVEKVGLIPLWYSFCFILEGGSYRFDACSIEIYLVVVSVHKQIAGMHV